MNHFVFADLSTFNVPIAKSFYSAVFGWEYSSSFGEYWTARFEGKDVGGLYETPKKFQDMGMPSFWMSYIRVANVAETVEKAKAQGGIIELVDADAAIGPIALVRDPQGAGFTIYQGGYLDARYSNRANSLVWNELFVSDFAPVRDFYQAVFGWSFEAAGNDRYIIQNEGEAIGAIQVLSNEIKGTLEYWGVFFAVENRGEAIATVIKQGGMLSYEDDAFALVTDPYGAAFHLVDLA